jgi:hypothetical protein
MNRDMEGRNVNISVNRFSVHGPSAAANINLLLFRNPRVVLYNHDDNDDDDDINDDHNNINKNNNNLI